MAALEEQRIHGARFSPNQVVSIFADDDNKRLMGPLGPAALDPVVDEVRDYSVVTSNFSGLKALHRIRGARAEVAWLVLGRAYFGNCYRRDARWTAGIHLLWWALNRLEVEPGVLQTDLATGPVTLQLHEFFDLADWYVVAARLMLVADIADTATSRANGVRHLPTMIGELFATTEDGSGKSLLKALQRKAPRLRKAFPEAHYRELAEKLHLEAEAPET